MRYVKLDLAVRPTGLLNSRHAAIRRRPGRCRVPDGHRRPAAVTGAADLRRRHHRRVAAGLRQRLEGPVPDRDGGRAYDAGSSFDILPTLVDAAGARVPLGDFRLSQAVADDDGYRRFVLRFTPAGMAAGDYSLRVRIRDPQSGREGESFQALRVE
jgi:hypothetical protein